MIQPVFLEMPNGNYSFAGTYVRVVALPNGNKQVVLGERPLKVLSAEEREGVYYLKIVLGETVVTGELTPM